ncbi:flagellar biosynthesis protein FlhF [uncultured Nevskia sp.]|uniref:flagellar biosynthesis protein FlhF n=1 Tax=uncultured Nevskia sp. TaxID=228950 RepID=UPI0025CD7D87|nr:flagellar biosynthesis protein FlhF [uncultured Nevskia sp.]
MKIKRFVAKNMREAIRMVREEQGPDSVILSNRRVQGGIEVVAAVDYDEALMQQSLRRGAQPADAIEPPLPEPKPEPLMTPAPGSDRVPLDILLADFGDTEVAPAPRPSALIGSYAPAPINSPIPMPRSQAASLSYAQSGNQAFAVSAQPGTALASHEFVELQRELGGMRRMLQEQLAGMAWNDLRRHHPQRYTVLKTLTDLGLDAPLAREIAEQLPETTSAERARFLPLGLLARRIPVAQHDVVLEGGVIALVGPTGVGKTTTIAKLAARYAEAHGLRDIALVAMDHYRIGAAEQLYTYGRLLGVPVYTVTPQQSLRDTLAKLSDRKLVLIDTVGMSPRDGALEQQVQMLGEASTRLKAFLTIAATSQSGDQDEVVRRFGGMGPGSRIAGCVLSKLDETTRIGGALSAAIRHQLPIAYVTDGQRVPEDLQVARADQLVIRAQQLARATPMDIDEETMAMRFASSMANGFTPGFDGGVQAHV